MGETRSFIAVLGSLNMDILVKAERKPNRGESILGTHFGLYPGGKGANQAVQIALLGTEVHLIGRVGADDFGDRLLDGLRQAGVRTEHVVRDMAEGTGMGCIFADATANNWIVVVPRANSRWEDPEIARALSLIGDASTLVVQLEIPTEVAAAGIQYASAHGVRVILNPSPARALPKELLELVDVLVPNETEASQLTGVDVNDVKSATQAALTLLEKGPKAVVLTLGEHGAVVAVAGKVQHFPAFAVQAVDPTAAGDAFCGALASGMHAGWSLEQAVRFAAAAGAISATRLGAQPSLPVRHEVEALLAQGVLR